MAIQTQQISKYVRDTEHNILRSDKSISGVWSFAVDTGNIFLTYQGSLIQWNPRDKKLTNYTIGSYDYTCQPIIHVDASDITTLKNHNFQTPEDGHSVVQATSVAHGGAALFEQLTGSKSPVFRQNELGSGLHSLRFSNGAYMNTDSTFNTTTHHGAFTVMMVLKFLPTFANWDIRGKTDSIPGTNEWLLDGMNPGNNLNKGLFHGTVSQRSTNQPSNIGAGMRWNAYNNNWRVEPGVSGNGLYQGDNQESDWENKMWANYSNPLEAHNSDALKDTFILCYEFPDTRDNPRSSHFIRVSTGGRARKYDWSVYYPSLIKGFTLGQWNGWFTGAGGHFDLGEILVFNNMFDRASMNTLGTHLSNKWDATWVNFE